LKDEKSEMNAQETVDRGKIKRVNKRGSKEEGEKEVHEKGQDEQERRRELYEDGGEKLREKER
jgi:hypothetical protein